MTVASQTFAGHGFFLTIYNKTALTLRTLAATEVNCMSTYGGLSGLTIPPFSQSQQIYVEITQTIPTDCRGNYDGHNVTLPIVFFDTGANNGVTKSFVLNFIGLIGGPYYCASTFKDDESGNYMFAASTVLANDDQTTCNLFAAVPAYSKGKK
ncbi:hypothetical protein [Leptospira alexanderi]|uniref:Uncharacterized protein n=2 Tax=Leptospira alexanderi TaxID=100053 RepID=V6I2E9_9LEPT|nr:hypothetical protein [Leptospira alexanderi]EQA63662.1 hypothetical protein LEP1GSC062_3896 [Leptospira alexanderi serovar Manhao 3 str. L 60]